MSTLRTIPLSLSWRVLTPRTPRLIPSAILPSSPMPLLRTPIIPALHRTYYADSRPPIFHLTDTELLLQETISRLSTDLILPKVREMDESEEMDPTIVESLFENGLMGIEIEEEYGGAAMNFGSCIVAIEELAKVDPSVSVLCDVHNTLVNTAFRKFATGPQKRKYLPRLATNEVGSFCLSEPGSGSDAFALITTATPTNDSNSEYKLSGSKCWITNALQSRIFLVFAQTNPSLPPGKKYKGITCFIVEKGTPGFSIAKKEKKLGIRASSTCVLTFDDVIVPKENMLGNIGEGYKIAMSLLNEGRVGIGAQMIGLAQGSFNMGAKYVYSERKQFGKYVGEFQGLGFQVAEARMQIEAARALVYNAVRTKEFLDGMEVKSNGSGGQSQTSIPEDKKTEFVMQAAMAKLYASRVAQAVSGSVIEWMGGMGFVRDGLAEKMWRDSKIGAIYEGTSNIQLLTIGKLLQKEYQQ